MEVPGLVQVVQSLDDFRHDLGGFLERKHFSVLFGLEVEQIAAITVLTHKILVVLVFFCVDELHKVGGVETFHAVDFSFKVVEEIGLLHEAFHGDELDSELLTGFVLDEEDLAVSAFT